MTRLPWLRLTAYAGLVLAMTAMIGGWLALDRVDPALVVPWTAIAALLTRPRMGWRGWIGAGAATGVLLAALAWSMAVMPTAGELVSQGLVAAVAVTLSLALSALVARVTGGAMRVVAAAVAAALWWIGGTVILDAAYAVRRAPPVDVLLITSLPLDDDRDHDARARTGGSAIADQLSGAARPSPVLRWLTANHRVERPADLGAALERQSVAGGSAILLLAHPPALDPADLVAIDAFVRAGGHAVVLADTLSAWPPPFALGNPLNPPVTTLLTPLLLHWGVRLGEADPADRPVALSLGDATYHMRMKGSSRMLIAGAGQDVRCRTIGDARGALCRIGRGTAVILSDADWLHPGQWRGGEQVHRDGREDPPATPSLSRNHLVRGMPLPLMDAALRPTAASGGSGYPRSAPKLRPIFSH